MQEGGLSSTIVSTSIAILEVEKSLSADFVWIGIS